MRETFSMFIHCTVLLEFVVMYSSIQRTVISFFREFVMLTVMSVLLTCLEFTLVGCKFFSSSPPGGV